MVSHIIPLSSHAHFFALVLTLFGVLLVPCKSFLTPFDVPPRQTKLLLSKGENAASPDDAITYSRAFQIRTRNGHDAAMHHYRQLLLQNPQDTSAATILSASGDSLGLLARVGRPYAKLNDQLTTKIDYDWEEDIERLNNLLNLSHYHHSSIRSHIFNLPTGVNTYPGGNCDQSMEEYKHEYPMGPSYIRPLVAGQGLDLRKMIDASSGASTLPEWLPSLQCLATLFLLSSRIPRSMFVDSVIGGEETLNLLLRLNIVFVFDAEKEFGGPHGKVCEDRDGEAAWVVPLIHLFPLEIPAMRSLPSACKSNANNKNGKNLVLMTDLHPTVLGMTSIPKVIGNNGRYTSDGDEEGAVMYIGPDSLALVHHLHASMLQYAETQYEMQLPRRILDVCTGSGIQAIATLAMLDSLECHAPGLAVTVDINERALRFTSFNARLNGFKDEVFTIRADLLSGEVYPRNNLQNARCDDSRADDASLLEELLNTLIQDEKQKSFKHKLEGKQKFDIFLANPPFIPVPPERSDHAAFPSVGKSKNRNSEAGIQRYGLFSSGGASGEDCLCAIVQIAPLLLRTDGGLMVVVSEFMNPPLLPSISQKIVNEEDAKDCLTANIEEWWGGSQQIAASCDAKGILFTNEFAISSDIYARRRAMTNDQDEINVWNNHLYNTGIHSVSPGLLFIHTRNSESEQNENGLKLQHELVPKTEHGSIWTPHNHVAVEFTRDTLLDFFR